MRLAWADALEEWLPEYSGPPQLRVLFASGDRPSPDEKHLICLSSFEMAARLYDTLKATQYKFVVVDEAHKLRGPAIPRPAPYTSSEVAAATAAAAVAGTTGTPHDATIKAAEEQLVESEAAPADAATSVKSMYFSTHERQREQKHRQQKEQQSSGCAGNSKGRVLRGRKICKPQGSGHEVNKKVLDLVRSSRHALLLSGTPSVKLPADLFPLVDALLPPLEQQDAADRRHQQLQQWNELVVSAAKAAAVAAGAVAACSRVSATDAKDLLVEEIGVENTKATAEPASCALVRSPWFEATEAWRTASAAAATTRSFAATGALPETYGQPLGSSAGATSEICDKSSLVSFTERAQERRRVGNILREERLQFAGDSLTVTRLLLLRLLLSPPLLMLLHSCLVLVAAAASTRASSVDGFEGSATDVQCMQGQTEWRVGGCAVVGLWCTLTLFFVVARCLLPVTNLDQCSFHGFSTHSLVLSCV